jgi:peptidoglycan/LPS O-acetylase OafA/YrhL
LIGGLAIRGGGQVAALFGELSFPLYATHFPVLFLAHDAGFGPATSVLACVVMAGIVAGFQHIWRLRRRRLPVKPPLT